MEAIVYDRYGSPDVLELQEIDKPVPDDDEVLIRVHAASVNPADCHLLTGKPYIVRLMGYGLRKPKNHVPGMDLAGRIEAVGKNVKRFQPGNEVFGESTKGGAYAKYVCVPEDGIVLKPPELTFEQAAAVPMAAFTALQGLRDKGQIRPGHKVLINGASGGVGTFAVQIAKSFGAQVTGVCSTRNMEMVQSIGADHVIDYSQKDFTQSAQRYDLILDTVGNHSLSNCRSVLNPKGVYVAVAVGEVGDWLGPFTWMLKVRLASLFRSQKTVLLVAKRSKDDLVQLKELIESGKVSPVIDKRYKLNEVPEAIGYLSAGHTRGKIVITV